MATSKYIRGLTGSGFRVPTNGSATALQQVTENLSAGANYQVDVDDNRTQKILFGENDNYVRVAASGSNTTTIIGLTRYGFRIKDNGGTIVTVKLGSGVHTIDLTKGDARRVLRRNPGSFMFSASATSAKIRGISDRQVGFCIRDATTGANTDTITNANPTNVNAADTVVVGTITYTFRAALTEKQATTVLSSDGTIPTDNDTVTVNNVTYRLKSTMTQANDVHLITDSDTTLDNLIAAVNGTAIGTKYFAGTAQPTGVTAGARVGTGASGKVTFTATTPGTAGNAFASTETSTHLSYSATTFGTGVGATLGVNPVINEVKIGGSADASLTNLSEAINAGANVGVDYSTTTVANPDATASAMAAHAITLTAVEGGSKSIAITESTTGLRLTVQKADLSDSLTTCYSGQTVTVNPQDPAVYTQLRRHCKAWIEV